MIYLAMRIWQTYLKKLASDVVLEVADVWLTWSLFRCGFRDSHSLKCSSFCRVSLIWAGKLTVLLLLMSCSGLVLAEPLNMC